MPERDMVVVGASSGGLEALALLLGDLRPDLPAALLVVLHREPGSPGGLEAHLARRSPLAVRAAQHGEPIEPGTVYLAPPNRHLLVRDGHLTLSAGPRENRSRPAIDKLFRSVAVTYRSRAIGVVLSGQLDDGATGLAAIETCGGLTAVQEPRTAFFDEMPANALRAVPRARRIPLSDLPRWLGEVAGSAAPEPPPVPDELALEARFDHTGEEDERLEQHGELTPLGSPECGGGLRRHGKKPARLRCHVGHAYTEQTLTLEQDQALESSMWAAIRSLREQARVLRSLVRRSSGTRESLEERAGLAEQHSAVLLDLLNRHNHLQWPELPPGRSEDDGRNGGNGGDGGVREAGAQGDARERP